MDIYCKSFSAYMVSSHMVVMEIVMNALDSIHIKVDSCIDSNTDLSSNNGHHFFFIYSLHGLKPFNAFILISQL